MSAATDATTGARVSVMVLQPGSVVPDAVLDAARTAARVAAGLSSTAVIRPVDVARMADGRIAIATEPFEGTPLLNVTRNQPLPVVRAVAILRQVCKVLAAAHEVGLVHRGLTLGAIILRAHAQRPDTVALTDFGLGALLDGELAVLKEDAAHQPVSPERISGVQADAREDLYLLGCVAYAMVTGGPPFRTGTPDAVRRRHAIEDPMPIADRLKGTRGVPPALAQWVHRLLAKEPDDRFADAAEAEAALCLAQIESHVQTPWDDLPPPDVDAVTAERIRQGLSPAGAKPTAAAPPADDEPEDEVTILRRPDHAVALEGQTTVVRAPGVYELEPMEPVEDVPSRPIALDELDRSDTVVTHADDTLASAAPQTNEATAISRRDEVLRPRPAPAPEPDDEPAPGPIDLDGAIPPDSPLPSPHFATTPTFAEQLGEPEPGDRTVVARAPSMPFSVPDLPGMSVPAEVDRTLSGPPSSVSTLPGTAPPSSMPTLPGTAPPSSMPTLPGTAAPSSVSTLPGTAAAASPSAAPEIASVPTPAPGDADSPLPAAAPAIAVPPHLVPPGLGAPAVPAAAPAIVVPPHLVPPSVAASAAPVVAPPVVAPSFAPPVVAAPVVAPPVVAPPVVAPSFAAPAVAPPVVEAPVLGIPAATPVAAPAFEAPVVAPPFAAPAVAPPVAAPPFVAPPVAAPPFVAPPPVVAAPPPVAAPIVSPPPAVALTTTSPLGPAMLPADVAPPWPSSPSGLTGSYPSAGASMSDFDASMVAAIRGRNRGLWIALSLVGVAAIAVVAVLVFRPPTEQPKAAPDQAPVAEAPPTTIRAEKPKPTEDLDFAATPSDLVAAGDRALTENRGKDAEALYQRAVVKEPKHLGALLGLGRVQLAAGDVEKAAGYFRRAVGAHPNDGAARIALGDALVKQGNVAEARKQYKKAKSLKHPDAAARLESL
ncbi:MAG: tetratricopeptide repeat protein [Nannocystaceae bacterium]